MNTLLAVYLEFLNSEAKTSFCPKLVIQSRDYSQRKMDYGVVNVTHQGHSEGTDLRAERRNERARGLSSSSIEVAFPIESNIAPSLVQGA